MIKGVNTQIVEINDTRDEYIERAILIINPAKSPLSSQMAAQKASQYLQSVRREGLPPPLPLPTARHFRTSAPSGDRSRSSKSSWVRILLVLLTALTWAALLLLAAFWLR